MATLFPVLRSLLKTDRLGHQYRCIFSSKKTYCLKRNAQNVTSVAHTKAGDEVPISDANGRDRLGHIMQMYEDVVGLTEVKTAQDKVVDAECSFLKVQEDRRELQLELTEVQNEVRSVGLELEKMHRTDPCYVDLVKKEHGILVIEKEMTEKLRSLDKQERDLFSVLSACVRESHEKERARAERTKYWSIIGSIVGAVIGITGSAINNHKRLKEMRAIIKESGQSSADYKDVADKVLATLASSPSALEVDNNKNNNSAGNSVGFDRSELINLEKLQQQTELCIKDIKLQTDDILLHLDDVKKLVVGLQSSDLNGNIVYVGPEISSLLQEAEVRFEKTAKKNTVMSVCIIGGVLTIGMAFFNFIFRGS